MVLITYSNSLGGEFVYDDEYFILKNVNIRNLANLPSFFFDRSTVAFSGLSEEVYRPLTTLTFALNYFLGNVDTFGYHLVNMLFHAFNAMLLFLFLYALFENIYIALFAGLFFACHPVQTEAVTWISGRGNVLFVFFYILTALFYVRFLKESKKRYYLYSILFCVLSVFSKEMAVTLPMILLACDLYFFKAPLRRRVYRCAPYFAIVLFYIISRSAVLAHFSQCGWWGDSPYYTFLTMLRVVVDYVKILIWPSKLCAFYAYTLSASIADTKVLISIAALVLIALSVPILFRRSKAASFAILWFFITLIPVSNIIPLKALIAERFLYLPSIGFCILLAVALDRIGRVEIKGVFENGRLIAVIAAVAIVITYATRTILRNEDWADSSAITKSILAVSPMNPWAYNALAAVYLDRGKPEKAIGPLKKAIALAEDYASPRSTLGIAYWDLGRYEEAARMFEESLSMRPDSFETMNCLGVVYAKMHRYKDAIREFERSLGIDPNYIGAYLNLAATYERLSDHKKAIDTYGEVARRTNSAQDIAISYIRIGDVYRRMKDEKKATAYYKKALVYCGRGSEELRKIIDERFKGFLPEMK